MRLHNDCDGGQCVACAEDERRAGPKACRNCYWWLEDGLNESSGQGEGICRRFRPSRIQYTSNDYVCGYHSYDLEYLRTTE